MNLKQIGERMNKDLWKRMLKFYKGNIKKTLKSLIKDERNGIIASKIIANRKIKFFKKLAKEELNKPSAGLKQ